MKTCCKNVNPTDVSYIEKYVAQCILDKIDRRDYSKFVSEYCSYTPKEIRKTGKNDKGNEIILSAIHAISVDVSNRIKGGNLKLNQPKISMRKDGMTGKVREIAIESIIQQVMEHVAVGCMEELWKKKYVYHQYASLKGKGQHKGTKTIQKWTKENSTKYFVKSDVKKCFGSFEHKIVMKFLSRDIGKNKVLLLFVEELLKNHSENGVGLLIGSLLSQYICNYMLSYAYRFIDGLYKTRRGKRIKLVRHILFFMDDFLLTGNDRRNLVSAMRKTEKYLKNVLHLDVKEWHVKEHIKEKIDMMGFAVNYKGKIKVRHRVYHRARRTAIRIWQRDCFLKLSRRFCAYYGFLKLARIRIINVPQNITIKVKSTKMLAANNIRNFDRMEKSKCCA